MAFQLPSISSLFRPTQQVAPTPGQYGQQPMPQQPPVIPPGAPGSSMEPQNQQSLQQGQSQPNGSNKQGENSPLDAWAEVWKTKPTDQQPTDPWSQPILPSDPNKIREAAGKMDMMAGVPPELLQKVNAGNDPQALMELMNKVAQNTLAMSAQLATASVERAGTVIRDRTRQELPEHFREYQLRDLPVDNPVLNHPGAQGLLQMTRQQLKMKNPDWSAQRIQDEAVKYLTSFAGAVSQNAGPAAPRLDNSGTPEQDWEAFLPTSS